MRSERAVFFRGLAVLFNSGLHLVDALTILSVQLEPPLNVAATRLAERLEKGVSLERAMASDPQAFTRLEVKMVEVGCRTGGLARVLESLAHHEEKQLALVARARAALTQPAIVFTVCVTLAVVLPPYLFRDLLAMLASSDTPLPILTKGLIIFSDLVRAPIFWVLATVGLAAAVFVVRKLSRNPQFRLHFYRGLFCLKAVGPALQAIILCRFAGALEATLSVGLPLQESLRLGGQAADNPVLEEAVDQTLRSVLEGAHLAQALETTGFFPNLFVQGIRVGEETGKLSGSLKNLTRIYDLEVDNRLEVMNALLEPVITAFIGAIVGLMVVATLLPMARFMEQL